MVKPLIPSHWSFNKPSKAIPTARLFRTELLNVRGGWAATFRRLVRIGPWGLYVIRYRAGNAEEGK